MRVISGTLGGRLIRGPEGDATRPITDRVKTNLFNILAPRIEDAAVADCFCGTGSLGIESLSRGARFATFAEIDGSALRLLQANLDELGLSGSTELPDQPAPRSRIVRQDVLRKGVPDPEPGIGPWTLVFFDPPYKLTQTSAERLWSKLGEAVDAGRLADGAEIVWRTDSHVKLAVPAEVADRLTIRDVRCYGSQTLVFISR